VRKSAAVPLVITSSLALALSGCSSDTSSGTSGTASADDAQYQGVCVDPATGQRVDDDVCDGDDGYGHGGGVGSGLLWYYFLRGRSFPAVGAPVSTFREGSDYVRTVPTGTSYVSGGADRNGGTVSGESLRTASTSSTGRVLSASESGSTVRGGLGSGSKAGS
jgi:hypothetical protein